ncbi:MAG: hypothetical protein NTY09_11260, partial [bacterium]|nr:hypothetical protein [bacterium]
MIAMQNVLTDARWSTERPEDLQNFHGQPIFNVSSHEEYIEVSLRYFGGMSNDLWISTIEQPVITGDEVLEVENRIPPPSSGRPGLEREFFSEFENRYVEPGSFENANPLTIENPSAVPDSSILTETGPVPGNYSTVPILGAYSILPPAEQPVEEPVEQEPNEEPLTIGGWQGRLAELLVPGEQPSGRINGSGLFMVIGPTF